MISLEICDKIENGAKGLRPHQGASLVYHHGRAVYIIKANALHIIEAHALYIIIAEEQCAFGDEIHAMRDDMRLRR